MPANPKAFKPRDNWEWKKLPEGDFNVAARIIQKSFTNIRRFSRVTQVGGDIRILVDGAHGFAAGDSIVIKRSKYEFRAAPVNITAFAADGTTKSTVTTGANHGFLRGQTVRISETTGEYDGIYEVIGVPSTTTFTIWLRFVATSTGKVCKTDHVDATVVLDDARNIASVAAVGTTASTVTTTANHDFQDGEYVTITGTVNYDGTHIITNAAGSTFNIPVSFVINATGTATSASAFKIAGVTFVGDDNGIVLLKDRYPGGWTHVRARTLQDFLGQTQPGERRMLFGGYRKEGTNEVLRMVLGLRLEREPFRMHLDVFGIDPIALEENPSRAGRRHAGASQMCANFILEQLRKIAARIREHGGPEVVPLYVHVPPETHIEAPGMKRLLRYVQERASRGLDHPDVDPWNDDRYLELVRPPVPLGRPGEELWVLNIESSKKR